MPTGDPAKDGTVNICLYVAFGVAFTVACVQFAFRPLGDPDFWWHLKTGELIVADRALPAGDPFNFTGDPLAVSLRERLVLQGYWLWQVIAYACYRLAGFAGVKLLGALTLLATYSVVGRWLLRSGVRAAVALPLLGVSLFLYQSTYALERPQVVTFLATAILVGFFVEIRRGERPSPWLYLLMGLWGNLHGGVIIGTALLGLFATGSLWDFRSDRQRRRAIVWWCTVGLLVSFLNPLGIDYYSGTLAAMTRGMQETVAEFRSTFWVFAHASKKVAVLWVLAIMHLAALGINRRNSAMADWLVSVSLVVFGVMYMRNMAFIFVGLLPMIAFYAERVLVDRQIAVNRPAHPAALAATMVSIGLLVFTVVVGWRQGERGDISRDRLPSAVGDFLAGARLQGNVFNDYNWGGYLLWRLYPQYKLFIDGRGIDEQAYDDYFLITGASLEEVNGRPTYQYLLEKYRVDYVVMHNQMEFGLMQKLMKYLLPERDWVPIYLDNSGFVLARAGSVTREAIGRYAIDKKVFLDRLLGYYDQTLRDNPERADFHLGRGELLGYIGRYDEAEREFATVQRLDPGHMFLQEKVSQLQKLREKTAAGR